MPRRSFSENGWFLDHRGIKYIGVILQIRYVMPSARLTLREEDVVRLTLEFLHNRELHISQLSLERETGVINGCYSDDLLFLRQLILDGQWDDVLEFIQPLEALPTFNMRKFTYTILRHKYIELLCIKSEANVQGSSVDNAVEEVVKVLNELEKFAPSKEEYSGLCLLLTLPRLTDHLQYKDWNPSNARVQCFREVYPLVVEFLPGDKKNLNGLACAKNDRLIQLIIKGVLYESCVNYCQAKATGSKESQTQEMSFAKLLDGTVGFSDSDLSLLSWLQSIPSETFSVPFEQRTLNVDVERLDRPSLETSWTEHMLITPIKPKTFPHSAMPFTRPRSAADIMTRSLMPALDSYATNPGNPGPVSNQRNMAHSMSDVNSNSPMSRSSFASFHLTGMKNTKQMNSSVDRLFENDGDVFLSNSYADFQLLPAIQEQTSTPTVNSSSNVTVQNQNCKSPERKLSAASTPEHKGRDSPASLGTARSSRRDSLNEKPMNSSTNPPVNTQNASAAPCAEPLLEQSFQGDLLKEFQKQKQKLQETLAIREKEREELMNQLHSTGVKSTRDERQYANKTVVNGSNLSSPASKPVINSPKPPNMNGNVDHYRPITKPVEVTSIHKEVVYDTVKPVSKPVSVDNSSDSNGSRPRFVAVTTLEDVQAVRCAEFHPGGQLYAVGSNSKTLRICAYPKLNDLREDHQTYQPMVLFKRTKHHKGSIYCLAWSPMGDLMATGSNDKTVKLMRFNSDTSNLEGEEIELSMHDGTVRDLCFLEDTSNKSSLLISGGAGDCKIYVTDCSTGTPFQALSGHTGHILSLYTWGGAMFVSGSHDKTVRFWDLRTRGCVNLVTPVTVPGTRQGSPVASLCVDPSGRLLVSGHEDSSCVLYDIRGGRNVQTFKPHSADVRSIRFSPSAYYLLTGGYDNKLVLTDLQGDLTLPLPSVVVAQHQDKVISGRWHPTEFSFLSASADKTATLWALPPV
ncbi:WD repeat-containing protein 47 isoform X2 [Agrilus planipennis]|uniref:WD repeat-containing protein 47 isoform X2 n=1 Tax=Agrilus planipennis TaxID=224129 RepID=A0A1W4WWR8_AGRPL|nr:WD repeat-containing protein 47 isoform X2 [Agrilus planipennis]